MMFEINEREQLALDLRGEGNTWDVIGRSLGVSANRARQITILAAKKRDHNKGIVHLPPNAIERLDLSIRAYNALKRAGLDTVEDILNCPYDLIKVRNLGQKSIEEIKTKIREYKGE